MATEIERPVFEDGWWMGFGYRFESEARAQMAIDDVYGFDAAMEPIRALPEALSRSEYEDAAVALGIAQLSEEAVGWTRGSHAARPPRGTLSAFLRDALAEHRLAGIEAERAARSKPAVRYIHCDCGHDVPEGQVMSASLGTSCFDCYDRMSH